MDLRRPWVKEAMKIWGGEDTAHLSERDMEDIQDDEVRLPPPPLLASAPCRVRACAAG